MTTMIPAVFERFLTEQYEYQRVFQAEHGPFPHPCYFGCGQPVDGHTVPRDVTSAVIHHIDGDHSNDALANLAAAHLGCHNRHHKTEYWAGKTPEERKAYMSSLQSFIAPEGRAVGGRAAAALNHAEKLPDGRSALAAKAGAGSAALTPEQSRGRSLKAWETRRAKYSPEEIQAQMKESRKGAIAAKTPEEMKAIALKGWETRRRRAR